MLCYRQGPPLPGLDELATGLFWIPHWRSGPHELLRLNLALTPSQIHINQLPFVVLKPSPARCGQFLNGPPKEEKKQYFMNPNLTTLWFSPFLETEEIPLHAEKTHQQVQVRLFPTPACLSPAHGPRVWNWVCLRGLLWDVQAQGEPVLRETKSLFQVYRPSIGLVMRVGDKAWEPGRKRRGYALVGPIWGWPYELLVPLGDAYMGWLASSSVYVCPPLAGMPFLASVPACTLSSVPLPMTLTRSCPTWEPLNSRQQEKEMSSVGKRRPSALGPYKPSRSVHS